MSYLDISVKVSTFLGGAQPWGLGEGPKISWKNHTQISEKGYLVILVTILGPPAFMAPHIELIYTDYDNGWLYGNIYIHQNLDLVYLH